MNDTNSQTPKFAQQTVVDASVSGLGLLAGVAALIGVSCCALPLLLAIAGGSGAWIAKLGVFVAYRTEILAVAVTVIALGWAIALAKGSGRRVLFILGVASLLIAMSFVVSTYERELNQYLLSVWRSP